MQNTLSNEIPFVQDISSSILLLPFSGCVASLQHLVNGFFTITRNGSLHCLLMHFAKAQVYVFEDAISNQCLISFKESTLNLLKYVSHFVYLLFS